MDTDLPMSEVDHEYTETVHALQAHRTELMEIGSELAKVQDNLRMLAARLEELRVARALRDEREKESEANCEPTVVGESADPVKEVETSTIAITETAFVPLSPSGRHHGGYRQRRHRQRRPRASASSAGAKEPRACNAKQRAIDHPDADSECVAKQARRGIAEQGRPATARRYVAARRRRRRSHCAHASGV
jgi:hypothetical protein